MITESPTEYRPLKSVSLDSDLVVVGGGLAGLCCAVTAARAGVKVTLVQDRPVLGGNASSEVRLWALGATSHMGNNNRWSREGGVVDEILVENTYRNPEGNPHLFDALLLDKAAGEPNIALLLNTAVRDLTKNADEAIESVHAFCSQNQTNYVLRAPLFCDASGDGILGFLSGAAFRVGAESRDEFGEGFAPPADYGELLGHTIYFYSKDAGRPVTFVPPGYALKDITRIPRHVHIEPRDHGCQFWWLEYGGRLDTVRDTEAIKWELWRVVYGVWDYIKNSGKFPEAANLTLEWVGSIPGKRESRRFEGDYMLTQRDVVEQRRHADAVSYGGWAMDLHPADGVYSDKPACTQWHSRGVYQVPYRCLYSRNIRNLFLAGRLTSTSHVAFGSTRVMLTGAHAAQAVGLAAAQRCLPARVDVGRLQRDLMRAGQHIPHVAAPDKDDLARRALAGATSALSLAELPPDAGAVPLDVGRALLIPAAAGSVSTVTLRLDAAAPATVEVQLRATEREGNFTPDRILASRTVTVERGENRPVTVEFDVQLEREQYVFVCLMPAPGVSVRLSSRRVTGVLSLVHGANRKVAKGAVQRPPEGIGVDSFEFWIPERRPAGQNLAAAFKPPIARFAASSVQSWPARPTTGPNAWVADPADPAPALTLTWDAPVTIGRIELHFDTDFDHAMESVQYGHPERAMPFCVKRYRLLAAGGAVLAECLDNHQTRNTIRLERPVTTDRLTLECLETHGGPAALFRVQCFAD